MKRFDNMQSTYSKSLKKKICVEICIEKKSTIKTAESYGIPLKTVEKWITAYNKNNHCFDSEEISNDFEISKIPPKEDYYESLSNEELKHQLIKKDIEIARLKKGYQVKGGGFLPKEFRYFIQKEYEVIYELSSKYPVSVLCKEMNIVRSGYYKWLARRLNPSNREMKRKVACNIFQHYHDKYPSHGYRWLNAKIKLDISQNNFEFYDYLENYDISYSDNYAHKICKYLGIKSHSKHVKRYGKVVNRDRFLGK